MRVQQRRRDIGLGGATQHVDMPGLNVRTAWREARDVEDLLDRPSRDRSIAKVTARDPAGHDLVDRALRSVALLALSGYGFFRAAHPRVCTQLASSDSLVPS